MQTDVLIIGCGIAGAAAALRLARDRERRVTVITRATDPLDSNSSWAQGGIVGRGEDDTAGLLVEDVLRAGSGLCNRPAVELLAEDGPRVLREVLTEEAGLEFDRDENGGTVYGLEGAHSRRRILHIGDVTGRKIMEALHRRLRESPNVEVRTGHTAVDLITFPHHSRDPLAVYRPRTCHGAYVFRSEDRRVVPMLARTTILASGGLGQIFLNTSNPPGARGDGLAMAYRAGVRIANLEYIQFHPTVLHMSGPTKFLISEAVRGEGGVLLTPDGRPFMGRYDEEWKDLAPRDVVARAIYWEMLAQGYSYVHLDIASRMPADAIRARFPRIHEVCLDHEIDITRRPIPVVPAAHYCCGGVLVDLDGCTTLPGLYAVGEVACTGVHGANRLASTSLLESMVWGDRAARHAASADAPATPGDDEVPPWDESGLIYDGDPALVHGDMQTIRNLMWHYVGLVRSDYRLHRALRELRHLWTEIEDFYRKTRLNDDLIGLRNAVQAALLVAQAARQNPRSLGCHFRDDAKSGSRNARPPAERHLELENGLG